MDVTLSFFLYFVSHHVRSEVYSAHSFRCSSAYVYVDDARPEKQADVTVR
jgi:hypothetical protein